MAYAPNVPRSGKIEAATNNIPTAFSSAAGSAILSGLQNYNHDTFRHVMVINETASRISVATSVEHSSAVPSSSIVEKVYVSPNTAYVFDDLQIWDRIYIQSESGSAITTGTVVVQVW